MSTEDSDATESVNLEHEADSRRQDSQCDDSQCDDSPCEDSTSEDSRCEDCSSTGPCGCQQFRRDMAPFIKGLAEEIEKLRDHERQDPGFRSVHETLADALCEAISTRVPLWSRGLGGDVLNKELEDIDEWSVMLGTLGHYSTDPGIKTAMDVLKEQRVALAKVHNIECKSAKSSDQTSNEASTDA